MPCYIGRKLHFAALLPMPLLDQATAIRVFAVCAFGYFLSTLLRVVTATLAPELTAAFQLGAADLGLLSGAYFLGFACTQLPLGHWLDAYGPRTILLRFMGLAVAGALLFALAQGFYGLFAARLLAGVGLSACLMAPLAGYRRWLDAPTQLRSSAWMLMVGSFGMVAATLPVQWLLPHTGWRTLFLGLAVLLGLAMWLVARTLPGWRAEMASSAPAGMDDAATRGLTGGAFGVAAPADRGYRAVWTHPEFVRVAPVAFVNYAAMTATQTLWAGPWLSHVAGFAPEQAAAGMFTLNVLMLLAFWLWGMVMPRLTRRGINARQLIVWGMPVSLMVMLGLVVAGSRLGVATPWVLALYCVTSTVVTLAQPTLAQQVPAALAGRALTSFNLLVFAGVFVIQSGVGALVDALQRNGLPRPDAYRGAYAVLLVCCVGAYLYFLWCKPPRGEVSSGA